MRRDTEGPLFWCQEAVHFYSYTSDFRSYVSYKLQPIPANAGPVALRTSSCVRLMERHLLHHQMRQHVCCSSLDMAYGACSDSTTSRACIAWCSRARLHDTGSCITFLWLHIIAGKLAVSGCSSAFALANSFEGLGVGQSPLV